jgi:glycosyltransferase involved in cell wall biosynthesis
MKIAMISTPFVRVPPRDYGGTELVVYELVEGLVRRGHEVTLFATGDSKTSAELRSLFPSAKWPPDTLSDLDHVSWAVREMLARGGFEVIHAHSAVALALRRIMRDPPLVYTIHHAREEQLSEFYRNCHDAVFVAISHDQARRELPLPRLTVIHHGLDPSKYAWTDQASDFVCFVSRLAPVKGPHTAIDVSARAGVPIRIAGDVHPPDRQFAERELTQRLSQPHVKFLGAIGMDVKVPLLRDARALLAPIEWNEPFGLILIEAMLSGCPVVAFPKGSVPELVDVGVTGFIARDTNEMTDIIRPGGPLDQFDRQRCRLRAIERFSRERMVEEHERLYFRVSTGRPSEQRRQPSRVA